MGSDDEFFQRAGSSSRGQDQPEGPQLTVSEALEAYSSEHPESIEELKGWYWKKFETLYESFMRRKAVEEATDVKNAMISGLWANSNYDDNKNTRKKALSDIEESYQESIRIIYNRKNEIRIDQDIDKSDPFFAAMDVN